MANETAICQWRDSDGLVHCQQPTDNSSSILCILHQQNPEKDRNGQFWSALCAKITSDEEGESTEIDLSGVVFPSTVFLQNRVFKKDITFLEACFNGSAHFDRAQFNGSVDFSNAHFSEEAAFWGVQFKATANFSCTKFLKASYFSGAEFIHSAYFVDTLFQGSSIFIGTKFRDSANFRETEFAGLARFRQAQFGKDANFIDAMFTKEADFSRCLPHESLTFKGETFSSSPNQCTTSFQDLGLDNIRRIRFEGTNLARVSFLRSDLSESEFVRCTWAERPSTWLRFLPRKARPPRKAVYDEVLAYDRKKNGEDISEDIPLIADLYRQLRRNLESKRQEAEAGDFYIGQMEMRRDDPSESWLIHRMLWVYRLLAMYGESLGRPLAAYFFLGLMFALAYLWGGFQVGDTPVKYSFGLNIGDAGQFSQDYVRAYIQALTAGGIGLLGGQFATNLDNASWWVAPVRYLNMLLDTFLVGFFVIALRRHFRR